MKVHKTKLLAVIYILSGAPLLGVTYVTDFSSLGNFFSDVDGQDGWTVSDPTDQYSFVANWNSSKAIGLGDVSVVATPPVGNVVRLDHGIGTIFGQTSVRFEFAIFDSYNDSGSLNRDTFGMSLLTSSGDRLSISLSPEVPRPSNPDDVTENSGDGAKWNLDYQLNGGAKMPLDIAIFEGSSYDFLLTMTPNADPALSDLNLSITGGNTLADTAVGLGISPESINQEFSLFWENFDGNEYGSNLLLVDNLSVIPESSSVIFLLISGIGLVCRRRRS